jgi:hypothetical protein
MSMLAFSPGLLRSVPIDPTTGLWTRPWLEYWQSQFDRIGGPNAPTNIELNAMNTTNAMQSAMETSFEAGIGTMRQSIESLRRDVAAIPPQADARVGTLSVRVERLATDLVALESVRAQLGTLIARVESVARTVEMITATQAHLGKLLQEQEQQRRAHSTQPEWMARLVAIQNRVEAIERFDAFVR